MAKEQLTHELLKMVRSPKPVHHLSGNSFSFEKCTTMSYQKSLALPLMRISQSSGLWFICYQNCGVNIRMITHMFTNPSFTSVKQTRTINIHETIPGHFFLKIPLQLLLWLRQHVFWVAWFLCGLSDCCWSWRIVVVRLVKHTVVSVLCWRLLGGYLMTVIEKRKNYISGRLLFKGAH